MTGLDISAILANFLVASLVYFFTNRERESLKSDLKDAREELKDLRKRYEDDLRDWSGIDPKFKTWHREEPLDSDTKIRAYMISEDERAKALKKMNE
jgi:chromosome segregation ATPase